VAASVIKQVPLAAASRQRPATSIGGGCGGGGAGGDGETAACSLGGDASCDVPVHALAAASDRSRPAAIALRLLGPLHMDVIMQKAAHRPAVGLRQNALGRILYSTQAIAQRFDEGHSHEQS
jgi:NAD(P)H-hydrate repair Nnr-like enzyme with NAD(P)H-hydrate epimerase domain